MVMVLGRQTFSWINTDSGFRHHEAQSIYSYNPVKYLKCRFQMIQISSMNFDEKYLTDVRYALYFVCLFVSSQSISDFLSSQQAKRD